MKYERAIRLAENAAKYVRQGWCQTAYARDAKGVLVSPSSIKACCWCASGALSKAAGLNGTDLHDPDLEVIKTRFTRMTAFGLVLYNETIAKSGEDVALVFDLIVAQLKQEASL